ncbi:MAG: site-2 protease family protein [Spirochaetota bacterium]
MDLATMAYSVPAIVVGLTVHEWAHAVAAYRLGDATARDMGRLSLNPFRHIDPFGFLFLIIAGFGWAKPVRFSRESLKRPKLDEAIIALAGPLSNVVLALVAVVILRFIYPAAPQGVPVKFVLYLLYINLGLFVFNMIPIPPLDGSHLIFSALRLKPETEAKIYRYGLYGLFGIILLGNFTRIDILPIGKLVGWISRWMFSLVGL